MATQNSPSTGNDVASSFACISNTALVASLVVRANPGKVFQIGGRLDSTAPNGTYYVQLFDAAAAPADATATSSAFPVPLKIVHTQGTSDMFSYDFGVFGLFCTAGCVVVLSSTEFTKTITSAYLSVSGLKPQN